MREWQAHDAVTEPVGVTPPPPAKKYDLGDYLFQFIVITAGVLIALLLNGLVDWNNNRELVEQARSTIRREVETNLKELEGLPESVKRSGDDLENALRLANDLISTGKTDVRSLSLNFNLATLNQSGWQSAERTGALGHMDYDEVQAYSELYAMQDLFESQQRKAVDLVATGSAFISPAFDPTSANRDDLTRFREHVMLLQANLLVTEQLGQQLRKGYQEFLQK
jgi:hypothetical protein